MISGFLVPVMTPLYIMIHYNYEYKISFLDLILYAALRGQVSVYKITLHGNMLTYIVITEILLIK